MSFDLLVQNGDLVISASDVAKVESTQKLEQDLLKICITPLGSNKFFPMYGSPIAKSMIGMVLDPLFSNTVASSQLRNSISVLQQLQAEQSKRQFLTAAEQIAALKNIEIDRDTSDPRVFSIFVDVISKALTVVSTQFGISPNG